MRDGLMSGYVVLEIYSVDNIIRGGGESLDVQTNTKK